MVAKLLIEPVYYFFMITAPIYNFKVGDVIKIIFKTPAGAKTKPTPFEGTVIALRGNGDNKTFTVRKISYANVAIEKIFPVNSASIEDVKVTKSGTSRRAKLYYLRNKR